MKIPFPLFGALPKALMDVFHGGRPVDRVVEYYFKNHRQWGSRDRRFFAETIFEIVRHVRKFWKLSGAKHDLFLDKNHLQLLDFEKLVATYFKSQFPDLKTPFLPVEILAGITFTPAEELSYSDWFYDLGEKELGSAWSKTAPALNVISDVYLRTNTLKVKREQVLSALEGLGVPAEAAPDSTVAIRLQERKNLFQTEPYKQGLFEIQDLSSQQVAELLDPKPGERVIDACAGAGGKTLHMASLMQNKGRIVAMDIGDRKLEELKLRARRNGVSIIETRVIDSTKVIKRQEASADAVLLDVPCSGSGVIKRNPDTKYRLTEMDWEKLLQTQSEILQLYSKMVKPGGRLVYATCSVFPSENEKQIEKWLASTKGWTFQKQKTLIPGRDEGDGFYMALLSREA